MSIQQQYSNCARTSPGVQASETNQQALCKQSIIQKTLQVGFSTLGSRVLGIIREFLMVQFLGSGAMADAFITAWKIPNSLRKIFAEGAVSAAFIPTLVTLVKKGRMKDAEGLMTLGLLVFEGVVLLLCMLVIFFPMQIVWLLAPGFSLEQIEPAIPFLRILIFFIFFISSSALLAGALQSVNHFFVPAFCPVLLNVVFISALLLCIKFSWPIEYLCYFILIGGFLQFLWHLITFFRLKFTFGTITLQAKQQFKKVLKLFISCLPAMSVMELSLWADQFFASFLPVGSIALIYYTNRFMGIPLGVFVTAFSTVLLPHFSRVASYAPKRMSFYLLEATKLIFWVTIPITLLMMLFSTKLFETTYLSAKFPMPKVLLAGNILTMFVLGLFFFSLNRILLSICYALNNTRIPAKVSCVGMVANVLLNSLFIGSLQVVGLALATSIAGMIQAGLYAWYLHKQLHFTFYFRSFGLFVLRYVTQLLCVFTLFLVAYYGMSMAMCSFLPSWWAQQLLCNIWFWLWVGPLCVLMFGSLYYFRRRFGVQLYFLG